MSLARYQNVRPAQSRVDDDMKRIFERFFGHAAHGDDSRDESAVVTSQWVPRVDIKEESERFVILADLPGIDPQEVEVLMDKGILSIKGERRTESAEQTERFSRIERRYGTFHRRFALPDTADAEGITARGHNGVLEIAIPKKPESTPRRIQVAANRVAAHQAEANQAEANQVAASQDAGR